jgi:thiol:disulfide interchange protein DsbD
MEASVWSDPEVLNILKKDYVLISLYVDDKTTLPEAEQYTSTFSGKKVKTLGNKWSDFQASKFKVNSQPYYVIVNDKEELLTKPEAFNLDISNYIRFLNEGKSNYQNKK